MSERMDERYGLDTPQEREREVMELRKKYQALEKERDALLLRECRHGAEVWKQVCASEVFQELKHGKYRDILDLLADGCISVGKAAQSIAERAGGVEPLLPEYQPMACDHPPSLMLKSAETGEPLYCEMCNTINERDDALKMEAVYKAENADLKQQVADGDLAFNHANEVVGKLEKERDAAKDALADYKGRLWCALGQPANIEFIAAVTAMHKQNDRLRNNYVELESLFGATKAENADLKAQVARLSAPANAQEQEEICRLLGRAETNGDCHMLTAIRIINFIVSRATPAKR